MSGLFKDKNKTQSSMNQTQNVNTTQSQSEDEKRLVQELGLTQEQVNEYVSQFQTMTGEEKQQLFEQLSDQQRQVLLANVSSEESQSLQETLSQREVATQRTDKDVEAFKTVQVSSSTELALHLQRAVLMGELAPEQAQTILQQRTETENLQPDPALEDVQYQSLAQMKALAESGDLDAIDKQKLSEIYDNSVQQARAARGAVKSEFAQRGLSGSNLELMTQLTAEDQAQKMRSDQEKNVASEALTRRRDAITGAATQASAMRDQQFGEGATKAKAQDVINQFNTSNQMQIELANLQERAKTNQLNLAEKQRLQELNVALGNEEATHNADVTKTQFEQEMEKAKGLSGAYSGMGTTTNVSDSTQNRQQTADTSTTQKTEQQQDTTGSTTSSKTGDTTNTQQSQTEQGKTGTTTGIASAVQDSTATANATGNTQGTTNTSGTSNSTNTQSGFSTMMGGVGSLMGGVAAVMSDKNNKKDIEGAKKRDVNKFLDEVTGYKYTYKPGKGSPGRKMGVMAQDLEKTDIASVVKDTPQGKMVDTNELSNALMAIVDNLGERVRKLEKH